MCSLNHSERERSDSPSGVASRKAAEEPALTLVPSAPVYTVLRKVTVTDTPRTHPSTGTVSLSVRFTLPGSSEC